VRREGPATPPASGAVQGCSSIRAGRLSVVLRRVMHGVSQADILDRLAALLVGYQAESFTHPFQPGNRTFDRYSGGAV
jgi:hypothetical protein